MSKSDLKGNMNWQPIDTAPKDRRILLYCPNPSVRVVGYWDDDRFSSRPKPYWTHDLAYLHGIRSIRENQPTHWMPLPEKP